MPLKPPPLCLKLASVIYILVNNEQNCPYLDKDQKNGCK